jgi:hypothetical protein
MIDHETQAADGRSARRWGTGAALVAAGLAGGVIIAGAMGAAANAATTSPAPAATSGTTGGATGGSGATGTMPQHPTGDQSKPQRSDESLLTGDTAAKVTAAALATYPNATIQRVETDSDGVYEAHVVTAAGDWVIVQVGKDFTVTGTQQPGMGGPGGGHGGPGNGAPGVDPDPNDNDGPGTSNPGGSQPGSSSTSGSTATPSSTG